MRVRVLSTCKAAYEGQVVELTEGETVVGVLAEYLATTGAPVEPIDEPDTGEATVKTDPDAMPDGPAAAILAWIDAKPDEAKDRAVAALAAEQAKDKPRVQLVAALEKLTAS